MNRAATEEFCVHRSLGSRLSKRSREIGTGLYCLLLLWEIISLEWIIASCSAIETRQNCV